MMKLFAHARARFHAFRGRGHVDVRLLFEALPHDPRVGARWSAAEAMAERVASEYGASLAGAALSGMGLLSRPAKPRFATAKVKIWKPFATRQPQSTLGSTVSTKCTRT